MWIVTGPFDGETPNDVGFQKSKLLKSGKSYLIGRKSTCDLVVNHKKVSHDHGQFVVGEFSPDDVANIDYTPTLRILNSKNKTMRIWREGVSNGVIINPGATETLKHNDRVDIVSGLPLTIQWNRICCFETPGKVRTNIPMDGCVSLGIHVVRTLHPDITHHLAHSYALTPAHMTSLLSAAQLVKPEWLSELLALSTLNPRESARALEHTFALPPEAKFRPAFDAALPPTLKTLKTWEPNETRLNMLRGYRFVFAGEKGLEIPAGYRDLVKRGGAEYEAFTVSVGVAVRWRKALVRAKNITEEKDVKVVLVADGDAMEMAVGADEWADMVSVAKSLELEFIQPENILRAVASVDTFFMDSVLPPDSQAQGSLETPLPDMVPNTFSEEPSVAPPMHSPRSSRTTRLLPTASERPPPAVAPLSEPSVAEPEIVEVSIPRRLPPRRATGKTRAGPSTGPTDDAIIVDASPTPGPPAPAEGDAAPAFSQLPTPISQTRRLPPRRRANQGIDSSSALISSSSNAQVPQSQFSQLDKYKTLFDATNPDRAPSETQHGTEASMQGIRAGMLGVVPEEHDSQLPGGDSRGTKRSRGARNDNDDDVDMAGGAGTAPASGNTHRAKRRALDAAAVPQPTPATAAIAQALQPRSNQVQRQGAGTAAAAKPSSKPSANHKLDTDENFLKAVNSTKRGKKLEDDFDREFNQLRIAKPKNVETAAAVTSAADAAVAPWDAIDDFGDVGIRGNFMVVVEMEVQRGGSARPVPPARTNDAHPEWAGRSNFKRFKTKSTAALERKPTVELVLSEENDYGIGNAYWRSAASGSQSYSDVHDITAAHPPPLRSKSKPASKTSRASGRSRAGRAPTPEDEDEMELDVHVRPPQSSPTTRSKAGAKSKPIAAAKPASRATKATTARAKPRKGSPARMKKAPAAAATRRTTRGKKPALFLSDDEGEGEDEDEDELGGGGGGEPAMDEMDEMDESAAAVAMELGAGEEEVWGTGTSGVGGRESGVDEDEREEAGMTSTLRSTAGTQSRREAMRVAKRRAAALVGADDDSDDAVFKGFGSRKRGRVR